MRAIDLIAKRRDGIRHTEEELRLLSTSAADSSIPDYQLAAWLMAAYLNPLDREQTVWLTQAMADTGERLDLSALPSPRVDKHSTGGVGDKTTLALLPLLASCGATLVKMSGRGLGITGGTLDKLESLPGFRTDLTPEEMIRQAGAIGLALTGQTPRLVPADRTLYSLRDAIGAVDSLPLIVSSILSKKIAGGADRIVLDVKCGSGGFMPTLERATELAEWLKSVGEGCGLSLWIAITDMEQPLGIWAGNALELKEAVRTLKGEERGRFRELCVRLAGLALVSSGLAPSLEEGAEVAGSALDSGKAAEKARAWFRAQGASVDPLTTEEWCVAPVQTTLTWRGDSGFVGRVDARKVGEAVVALGGGRKAKGESIDASVGVGTRVEVGDALTPGQVVFEVHARSEADAEEAVNQLLSALEVQAEPVPPRPVVIAVL